jgi:hypothetical protein
MLLAASPVDLAQANPRGECQTETQREFLIGVNVRVHPIVTKASPKALAAVLKARNKIREASKLWPLEADTMLIGVYRMKDAGLGYAVGTVLFKDDCMVPGSPTQESQTEFLQAITTMGLTMDDFSIPVALPVIKG